MTETGGERGVTINSVLLMLCVKLMTKARNMEILAFHTAENKTVAYVLPAV
jgi:NADH:ubiquinone oxidoreductase subunit K